MSSMACRIGLALVLAVCQGLMVTSAQAATIYWDGSGPNWNSTSAWSTASGATTPHPTAVPGPADVASFNISTVKNPQTVSLAADQSALGVSFTSTGSVSIAAGNTLTLGVSGIDMTTTNGGAVTISSGLTLGSGNQVWNVASNRTLTMSPSVFNRVTGAILNLQGTGTVATTSITNNAGIVGAWATVGTTNYATVSGGNIVGLTGTAAADGAGLTDTTGTANYDLAAGGGTVPANVSLNTIRYTGAVGTTALGATSFTVNGLMNVGSGLWTIGTSPLTIGAARELVVNTANNSITISSSITNNAGGASALTKTSANTLTLTGTNTYTGVTTLNGGILSISTLTDGDIVLNGGANNTSGRFIYSGAASKSTGLLVSVGLNGGTLESSGSGVLTLTNTGTIGFNGQSGARTFRLAGNNTGANTFAAVISDNGGATALVKTGNGKWILSAASTYTGGTTFGDTQIGGAGTLETTTDNVLPNGVVTFGVGITGNNATLNLGGNQTLASLGSAMQSSTATVNIPGGKTLTVSGNMTLGNGNGGISATTFNFPGGGNLVVGGGTNSTIQIGASYGANYNAATVDMSFLASFSANLGTGGTFRVGDNYTGGGINANGGAAKWTNAPVSSITAGNLLIGDRAGAIATHALYLGSVSNTINAKTIAVGMYGSNGGASGGILAFATNTGTVVIRSTNGIAGDANLYMISATPNSSAGISSSVALAGHYADVSFNAVTMANLGNSAENDRSATLTFDTGNFSANSVTMSKRSGSGTTGNTIATITIGGGTASLGAVSMAQNLSSAGAGYASATLTITNGTVMASSINMATAVASRISYGTISLKGGSLTISGNITRSGGAGTETTTLTLTNNATLDMGGFSIGTSAAPIGTLNFQSGTLRNVADINGGAAMIKTTTGTLTLAGVNSYTGATTVVGGVLRLTGGAAINDSATLNVSSGAKISVVNNETIGQLYLGGVQKPGSTYGSSASSAAHKDDVYFDATQSGVVTVRFPPPAGTAVLFF